MSANSGSTYPVTDERLKQIGELLNEGKLSESILRELLGERGVAELNRLLRTVVEERRTAVRAEALKGLRPSLEELSSDRQLIELVRTADPSDPNSPKEIPPFDEIALAQNLPLFLASNAGLFPITRFSLFRNHKEQIFNLSLRAEDLIFLAHACAHAVQQVLTVCTPLLGKVSIDFGNLPDTATKIAETSSTLGTIASFIEKLDKPNLQEPATSASKS